MPSGAARVRTTSSVCGSTSSATKKVVDLLLPTRMRERHRLGGGGRLVEHRRAGDRHAGEVADHGLEVDQRLHPALRDLGLVGRVGGVPGRVLEDVAQDDARRVRAVVALADEALEHAVARRDRLQFGQRLRFGERRGQRHRPRARDAARHDGLDQRAPRRGADGAEHLPLVGSRRADVAGDELGSVLEFGEGGEGGHQHGSILRGGRAPARRLVKGGRRALRASSAARRTRARPSAGRTRSCRRS